MKPGVTLFAALRADGPVLVSAAAPPVDDALLRGDGVFETVLVRAGAPVDLAQHAARLVVSARLLGFEAPAPGDWHSVVMALGDAALGGAFDGPDWVLRLTATRSGSQFASAAPVPELAVAQRGGISVILGPDPFNRSAPYATTGAKTLSYATNLAAQRWAQAQGADDVIFTAPDGTIGETPTATVILAVGGELVTPTSPGLLPSITAARLSPRGAVVTAADLLAADAVHLVSAIRLAAPVVAIDGISRPVQPAITDRILRALM